jgi:hypothetical protein
MTLVGIVLIVPGKEFLFSWVSILLFSRALLVFRRRGTPFGLGGAQAGTEDENAPGKINPQQQCHDAAERPIDRVQRSEILEVDHE